MKFEFKKEKLKQLTSIDLEELGWEKKVLPSQLKSGKILTIFEKGNYFLSFTGREEKYVVIRIGVIDPTLIDWMHDPENFRMTFKCPSRDHFEVVESLLT